MKKRHRFYRLTELSIEILHDAFPVCTHDRQDRRKESSAFLGFVLFYNFDPFAAGDLYVSGLDQIALYHTESVDSIVFNVPDVVAKFKQILKKFLEVRMSKLLLMQTEMLLRQQWVLQENSVLM